MTFTDQAQYDLRCEWGLAGLQALAPAQAVIIVDVLSFTSCVDIALSRGAQVLAYPLQESETAPEFARRHHAQLAGKRGQGGLSLSPQSMSKIEPGSRLVLPSPNGSRLAYLAKADYVYAACLRNARAVAQHAAKVATSIAVIPAGERWRNDHAGLRPALEDLLGAGAVIHALGVTRTRSPEAYAAATLFETMEPRLADVLSGCASGRELIERGYTEDVALAAELNVSEQVPLFQAPSFVPASIESLNP